MFTSKLSVSMVLGASIVVGSLVMSSTPARAETPNAYVCDTLYTPATLMPIMGDHGYLVVTWYSQPQCTGTKLGWAFAFTKNAWHPWADDAYLYSEAAIQSLAQMLQRAAFNSQKVRIDTGGPEGVALKWVQFRGD